MTRPALAGCLALLLCTLTACVAAPAGSVRSGTYQLTEQQQLSIGQGVTLRYDAMLDSRCPPAVQCIWAGRLSYRLTLGSDAGTESFELTPGAQPYTSRALKGVQISLADDAPAPHAIKVRIERSSASN